jgi:hypothetical protein
MKNLKFYIFGLLFLSLNFISCNKDENLNLNVDKQLITTSSKIDLTNELDFNSGIDALNNYSSYSNKLNTISESNSVLSCATVTVNNPTPGVFPKSFTVDFGTGCNNNGITRSGIITITISNYILNSGSIMTIQRGNNYYVNGEKIEGTIVYENTTVNPNIPQWIRTITNGKITTSSGIVFNHYGTRTIKQIEGANTLIFTDNIYEITSGNHTIIKEGGFPLNITVVEPLIKKYTCNNISQGKLKLLGSFLDGILDYGNNQCDNLATYTHSNGSAYNITLN